MLIAAPLLHKCFLIEKYIYSYGGSRTHGAVQTFVNDAEIYLLILTPLYLSFVPKLPSFLVVVFRVFSILIFGVYLIDYIVLREFNTHLTIDDFFKFASYAPSYIYQTYNNNLLIAGVFLCATFGSIYYVITNKGEIRSNLVHGLIATSLTGLFLSRSLIATNGYVHSWVYRNVLDYNLESLSASRTYSAEFIKGLDLRNKEYCHVAQTSKSNVIILMVESLSSYQSGYFSGIRDWTPNVDRIARSSTSYVNFFANGFTTEDAEISLLTGLHPIPPPAGVTQTISASFKGFYDIQESLPRIFNQAGYNTEFLTTADLEFSNTGHWARNIGFAYIEGSNHPYYDDWKRYQFNAAPDEALYHRVLNRLNLHKDSSFLLFIKTASTHHPFIDPVSDDRSEVGAFKYADKQIGSFYDRLVESGYFKEGILIILGDHHAMIPLKREEIEKYGAPRAAASVPLIVSNGNNIPSIEKAYFQQIDIYNSLKGIVSGTSCFSEWVGNLFGQETNSPTHILHKSGSNRDRISIFSGNEEFQIKLDGDNTRLLNKPLLNRGLEELLVNKINTVRTVRNISSHSQSKSSASAK